LGDKEVGILDQIQIYLIGFDVAISILFFILVFFILTRNPRSFYHHSIAYISFALGATSLIGIGFETGSVPRDYLPVMALYYLILFCLPFAITYATISIFTEDKNKMLRLQGAFVKAGIS
jgi:hypothetical protein